MRDDETGWLMEDDDEESSASLRSLKLTFMYILLMLPGTFLRSTGRKQKAR
jgi:hypothetical protein